MEEVWRDIEGYEGLYQVSSLGRVRSLDRTVICKDGRKLKYNGVIKKPYRQNSGYLVIDLNKDSVRKHYLVHRLVAEAFIPNPEGKEEINHISENKDDNSIDNLEWISHKENCRYGTRNIRNGKKMGIPVMCVETGQIYQSACEAMRQTGIYNSNISKACYENHRIAGGYHWKFVED